MAKRLAVLLASVVLLFSVSQTAALASSNVLAAEPDSHLDAHRLIALAASSRFAAEAAFEGEEPTISEARLDEMREQRRQWQSQVSEAADTTDKEAANSADQAAGDPLNLNEIVEENEIVDELTPPYGRK
ncbi:hypothetical protein [Leptolyngbya sp. KIOST-1]|uniref:hypothetical protein n=1 Tax=Leptolyngbya sp. KIOST-1 TaxID=1229172 RepID=UPI00056A202E|nr:hypothetical protein [Leptolyngbya sp. KIOST-1]